MPLGGVPSVTQASGYDSADRVTGACYGGALSTCASGSKITYAYDKVGNRSSQTKFGTTTTYTYDGGDELTGSTVGSTTTLYSFDNDGQQTGEGYKTYSYNLAGQLTQATDHSTVVATFTYDGNGNRLTKTASSVTTNYGWDENNDLPMLALEWQGSTTLRDYLYGDRLISMNTGGAAYYFHHDALDTTAALTKSTAAVEWTYTYDPYGNTRTTTKVDPSAPANPIQYTGELLDSETALYDLRARTYNPQNGGFLSTDPLTPDTDQTPRSLYLYANAEPLLLTDPTGQYAEDEDPNGNTTILTGHPCPAGGGTWYQDPTECRDTTTAPSPNPGAGGGNTDEGGSAGEAGGRSTSFQPAADEPGGDGVPPELGDPIQPPKPVEDGVAAGQRYETSDGAILEMTPYAANRATGRRVTATEVTQALSYPPREFWQRTPKPGQWRIGYYDPIRRTFVSREQGRIVNVIQPVTKGQYNDIMRRRPTRGR